MTDADVSTISRSTGLITHLLSHVLFLLCFPCVVSYATQPENVLLDQHHNVKITGFALAGWFDPSLRDDVANLMHATCGTPDYTAPEVMRTRATRDTQQETPIWCFCCVDDDVM